MSGGREGGGKEGKKEYVSETNKQLHDRERGTGKFSRSKQRRERRRGYSTAT